VHCDIKPENIMLQDNQIKLIDFGLASKFEGGSKFMSHSGGTYGYMAPE